MPAVDEAESVEPMPREDFDEALEHAHFDTLVNKGYTPHRTVTKNIMGAASEFWWDNGHSRFEWPMAATLIALMVFVLLIIKGVPW